MTAYKDTLCVHGACENTEGSFICKCSTGLMFDGNANCTGKCTYLYKTSYRSITKNHDYSEKLL